MAAIPRPRVIQIAAAALNDAPLAMEQLAALADSGFFARAFVDAIPNPTAVSVAAAVAFAMPRGGRK